MIKQAELEKRLNAAKKLSAKKHGWKSSRGFLFRATDFLFFTINATAWKTIASLNFTSMFKPLAFDDLFWTIVNLEENVKQPLSFRASGVWTAPMSAFAEGSVPIANYEEHSLLSGLEGVFRHCEPLVKELAEKVTDFESYLAAVEESFSQFKQLHPNSARNIWVDRFLCAVLSGRTADAREIVNSRKASGDDGGFVSGPGWKTFYDQADEYLDRL